VSTAPGYGTPPQGYAPPQPPPKKRRAGKIALLGCGGLVALVVIIVVIIVAVGLSKTGSGSNNAPSPATAAGKLGSKVRDGKFQFVVTHITHAKNVGDTAQGLGDPAQGEYTVLHVTVTNISNQAQTLDDSAQYVYDGKGRQFSASSSADIDGNGGNGGGVFLNQINPGDSVHGRLYFDMPKGDSAVTAQLHDSTFSNGVTVSLRT
jgi:hypothetical protein